MLKIRAIAVKHIFMKLKNNHWYSLKLNVHLPSNRRKKENKTKYMAKKLVRKVTVFCCCLTAAL